MEQRSARDGWDRVEVGSLIGNLPELLAWAIAAPTTRIVIIEPDGGGRYVQALCAKGDIHVECSSDAFLEEDERLGLDEELALISAGFEPPSECCPNWSWDAEGIGASIEAAAKLAEGIFGVLRIEVGRSAWLRQFDGQPC